jgi:hypothetical protein
MRTPEQDGQVGWAIEELAPDIRLPGWSAWAGDTYISWFDTGQQAREAVESAIGCSLRWVKDRNGVYLGVV